MLAAAGCSDPDASPAASPSAAAERRRALHADGTTPSSAALEAQHIDEYDFATNVLRIPLVQVGETFYSDVRITVGPIHGIGLASATAGVFDHYDAATQRLVVPVVRAGGQAYFNVELTPERILSVGPQVASYSVPTDLGAVRYPESYTTPTRSAVQVNRDPCRLDLAEVTYPATWLGSHPLPPIHGAPLPSDIVRGVMLKDIGLQPGNPAFILSGAPGAPAGCSADLRASLDRTLDRLKRLGADFVDVTPWRWATSRPDGSWTFTDPDRTFGAMSRADFAYLVSAAHALGLKVMARNQIQGWCDPARPTAPCGPPPFSIDNFRKWFGAFQAYIAETAVDYQRLGVDIWELGCSACIYFDTGDGSAAAHELATAEYLKAAATVRAIFQGQLMFGGQPLLWDGNGKPTPLMSRIDIIASGIWLPPSTANLATGLSVASYKAAVQVNFESSMAYLDRYGKTLLISMNMQSRADAFSLPGYLEETACTPGFGSFETSVAACIQRGTHTDLALQAIVHEASFEMIGGLRPKIRSPLMVNVQDYWQTDSLMPFTAFPNIATSIRNKPAEGIAKAWFAR